MSRSALIGIRNTIVTPLLAAGSLGSTRHFSFSSSLLLSSLVFSDSGSVPKAPPRVLLDHTPSSDDRLRAKLHRQTTGYEPLDLDVSRLWFMSAIRDVKRAAVHGLPGYEPRVKSQV